MKREEIAELLGVPPGIRVTGELKIHVNRLVESGSLSAFTRNARRLFDEMDPWPANGPTGLDVIDMAVRLVQTPGSTLTFISHVESLLANLDMPLAPSLPLNDLKRRLRKVRTDGRLIAVAIGEEQGAHLITVDALVPDPTASLRDAVEDLAIRAMTAWRSRPGAGVAIPMRLISNDKGKYFINGTVTKTTLRDVYVSPELVMASNRIAAGIPGRHRLGIDPDVFLLKTQDYFIPALDKDGVYKGPEKPFERHWYGLMLKRRVKDWCKRERLSRDQTEHLLARISGKSSRRGGQTDSVFLNMSLEDCSALAHFESSHIAMIYSEGFDVSATSIANYVTSRAEAAFDRMNDRIS